MFRLVAFFTVAVIAAFVLIPHAVNASPIANSPFEIILHSNVLKWIPCTNSGCWAQYNCGQGQGSGTITDAVGVSSNLLIVHEEGSTCQYCQISYTNSYTWSAIQFAHAQKYNNCNGLKITVNNQTMPTSQTLVIKRTLTELSASLF